MDTEKFQSCQTDQELCNSDGKIFGCGSCIKIRHSEGSETCPLSTMKDLYAIIKDCDKILTF